MQGWTIEKYVEETFVAFYPSYTDQIRKTAEKAIKDGKAKKLSEDKLLNYVENKLHTMLDKAMKCA